MSGTTERVEIQRDDGPLASAVRTRLPVPAVVNASVVTIGTIAVVALVWLGGDRRAVALLALGVLVVGSFRSRSTGAIRAAWLAPPSLRLFEYAAVIALASDEAGNVGAAAAFAHVLAASYHHYDTVYRVRHDGHPPPRWVIAALGGWEGRTAIVVVAWLAGYATVAAASIGVWCGLVATVESIGYWRRAEVTDLGAPTDEGDVT